MAANTIDQVHENWVAQMFDGHRDPSSGSRWHNRGDVVAPPYLISCKATEKKSKSISLKDWEEISDQTYERGLTFPVMAYRFLLSDGGLFSPHRVDLVALNLHDFLELTSGRD